MRAGLGWIALLTMGATGWDGSRLAWGDLKRWGTGTTTEAMARAVANVTVRAQAALDVALEPVAVFHLEGTLNSDRAHQAADHVKAGFPAIFDLAVCARLAVEPLRGRCLDKAGAVLLAWADVYRPSGNPIDERFFVPVLQAVDLVGPILPSDRWAALLRWTRAFATAGDAFYDRRPPNDTARSNNWMSARLMVRAIVATICADRAMQDSTRAMLDAFATRNFVRDAKGRTDGTTFDFVQRDALLYHVADLLFLTTTALIAPGTVSPATRGLMLEGLTFLKPFYRGERQHVEFVNSTVSFDRRRRDEDVTNREFTNAPWKPAQARPLLRLARLVFPEIQAWTGDAMVGSTDARSEILAAAFGEGAPR
jgi:hypothetical protein